MIYHSKQVFVSLFLFVLFFVSLLFLDVGKVAAACTITCDVNSNCTYTCSETKCNNSATSYCYGDDMAYLTGKDCRNFELNLGQKTCPARYHCCDPGVPTPTPQYSCAQICGGNTYFCGPRGIEPTPPAGKRCITVTVHENDTNNCSGPDQNCKCSVCIAIPTATPTPTPGEKPRVSATPTPSHRPTSTPIPPSVLPTIPACSACTRKGQGDANCDAVINDADYTLWLADFSQSATGCKPTDFNSDSKVNLMDFEIWRNNRYVSTPTLPEAKPTITPMPNITSTPTEVPTSPPLPTSTPTPRPTPSNSVWVKCLGDYFKCTDFCSSKGQICTDSCAGFSGCSGTDIGYLQMDWDGNVDHKLKCSGTGNCSNSIIQNWHCSEDLPAFCCCGTP